jgi:hydrogenase 3 maturation protease
MLYLLCFGNPYLEEDNLAINIADSLIKDRIKGLEIIKCISPDEILSYTDKDFYILDVVKDAEEVMLIDDIDRLKTANMVSLHDFDLGFFLKLMKETGRIDKIKIIGIPQSGDISTLKKDIINMLPIENTDPESPNTSGKSRTKEYLLLGVGNTLRADDGIGCYIANKFNTDDTKEWETLDCGTVPENFTSAIRKKQPKTVVIVDSAEMNLQPGQFRMIPKEKLSKLALTTHAMPLSVLIDYIEEFIPKVIFIGIQPKQIETKTFISPELKKTAEEIIAILKNKEFQKIPPLS